MKNQKGKISGIGVAIIVGILLLILRGNSGNDALRRILGLAVLVVLALLVFAVVILVLALKNSGDDEPPRASSAKPVSYASSATSSSASTVTSKAKAMTPEENELMREGRFYLRELRQRIMKIHNPQVRQQSTRICDVLHKILQTLNERPEKISQIRQFFSYYLPTFGNVLKKYQNIEQSGIRVEESTNKILPYLDTMENAMEKQYENLFQNDLLDMRIEMEAMAIACKQDGLLDELPVFPKESPDKIKLSL